jgi:hypothetical protein
LAFYLLEFFPDALEEVLEIFLFGVELLELSSNPAVFTFVVGEMTLAV